mmetsp:Transcript_2840/g.8279  ORF Transcript_2840/g.8279 Transcript_2840/m.8279 type:complete len:674 (+) Transcript_2840:328-2349(+)
MAPTVDLDSFVFGESGGSFVEGASSMFDDTLMAEAPDARLHSLDNGGAAFSLDNAGVNGHARRGSISEHSSDSAIDSAAGATAEDLGDMGDLGELPAALASSVMMVRNFANGREPTLKHVCEVLKSIHGDGRALSVLTTKPSASPIEDAGFQVYVMNRRLKKERGRAAPTNSFAVTFQSVHNSEVWFEGDVGVTARPMGRSTKRGGASVPHGYRGKLYTLIERAGPDDTRSIRVVDDALGLVRVWRVADEGRGSATSGDSSPPRKKRARSAPKDHVSGDLRVKGDLVVDGCIQGRVVTPEGAADYAEWFPWAEGEGPAPPGSVARLEDNARLSLDTRGPGPCMVISTSPSIAAGVPDTGAAKGALMAFMGQVPIRCVGPVAVGDRLVPSGRGDGLAVSEHRAPCGLTGSQCLALGTAMAASNPGGAKEHTVLAFVRWQAAVRRELEEDCVSRARLAFRYAMIALAVAVALVAVAAEALHFELLVCHNFPSVHAALFAALMFLSVLQAFLLLALVASYRGNAPCKAALGVVSVFALVVACLDVAHGSPTARTAPSWLVLSWCVVSTAFHLVALACAALVISARVAPPPEEKLLDYAEFDDKQPATRKPRLFHASTWVAIVATVCAFLWLVGAPPIIAVMVINRNLNRRINHLEDDLNMHGEDDNWTAPRAWQAY